MKKFRVWNNETEEMIFLGETVKGVIDICLEFSTNYDTSPILVYYYGFSKRNYSDIVVMQNTGLIDINGVEIYEGDIVEHNKKLYKVKFGEGRDYRDLQKGYYAHSNFIGFFLCPYDGRGNEYSILDRAGNIRGNEVVGNLYEGIKK